MLGKKSELHPYPDDPPRRRANKQRGHGNYDNDRPPIVSAAGRTTRKRRLRVVERTDRETLQQRVHQCTKQEATCYTDEWRSYNGIEREHSTVNHGQREWARDDNGDGIREARANTIEGLWTAARNYLRPFRGAHKKYLKYYVAMCERRINLKQISPRFISQFVTAHSSFK
jgi:transposase-like protein